MGTRTIEPFEVLFTYRAPSRSSRPFVPEAERRPVSYEKGILDPDRGRSQWRHSPDRAESGVGHVHVARAVEGDVVWETLRVESGNARGEAVLDPPQTEVLLRGCRNGDVDGAIGRDGKAEHVAASDVETPDRGLGPVWCDPTDLTDGGEADVEVARGIDRDALRVLLRVGVETRDDFERNLRGVHRRDRPAGGGCDQHEQPQTRD